VLNLTNWLGNVIMPTVAGLFAAAAIFHFSKGRNYQHLAYAALASLMCSGLLRALESFSNQAAWNNPDRYWISILTLVNWVGNVLLPLYGVLQIVLAVTHYAGLLERMTVGEAWVRNLVAAMCSLGLSDCCDWGSSGFNMARRACPNEETSDAVTSDTGEPQSANEGDFHVFGI
jgi:hypothetical protein